MTLRDGTTVIVRPLTAADKPILRAGFDKLSPESRYARFLAPKSELSDDELQYLCDVDQVDHVAIGAVDEHGEGAGIARFIRLRDRPNVAEAAVAVADSFHRKGLGKLLFERLCEAAKTRGIERFRCEVLGSNTSMQALLEKIAPERTIEVGSGVMSIELPLPGVPPAPESGMYRLFRAAAENTIDWTEAVRRLWRR